MRGMREGGCRRPCGAPPPGSQLAPTEVVENTIRLSTGGLQLKTLTRLNTWHKNRLKGTGGCTTEQLINRRDRVIQDEMIFDIKMMSNLHSDGLRIGTLREPSMEEERTVSSEGLKTQDQTVPAWPWRQQSCAPVSQSHSRTVLSSDPAGRRPPDWGVEGDPPPTAEVWDHAPPPSLLILSFSFSYRWRNPESPAHLFHPKSEIHFALENKLRPGRLREVIRRGPCPRLSLESPPPPPKVP